MDIKNLSLESIIEKIHTHSTSPQEIFDYFLKRIEKYNPLLSAFSYINKNPVFTHPSLGESLLAGAPLGVKDIFCEKGIPTTCASKMLADFVPPYSATLVERLTDAGASFIGKLNMDEYAMGSTGENSCFAPSINPWGKNRIPGGSSSGSAVAVAAGLVPATLGTDTGGSIRQPASMCGIVGFKPSYGRNSRYGVISMASSLDCPGTFTRTVKDAALLYTIMNGEDPHESTSLEGKDVIDPKIFLSKKLSGISLGVPKEYFDEGLDEGVKKCIFDAIEVFKKLGAEIKEISLPMTKYAIATYYIIMPAEVSTNLSRYDGVRYGLHASDGYTNINELFIQNRSQGFGDETKRRIALGNYVLSAGYYDSYFKKATQVRTLIADDFHNAFSQVDGIISPVSPSVAWKIGEKMHDPMKMYLSDIYTVPASLAGLPGISVPAGFALSQDNEKEKLPVGLQILTPRLEEQRLFEIAYVYEQATNFGVEFPEGF